MISFYFNKLSIVSYNLSHLTCATTCNTQVKIRDIYQQRQQINPRVSIFSRVFRFHKVCSSSAFNQYISIIKLFSMIHSIQFILNYPLHLKCEFPFYSKSFACGKHRKKCFRYFSWTEERKIKICRPLWHAAGEKRKARETSLKYCRNFRSVCGKKTIRSCGWVSVFIFRLSLLEI